MKTIADGMKEVRDGKELPESLEDVDFDMLK
jgi:hypothetical protein